MILAEISISEQDSPASFLLIFTIVSRLLNVDKASWRYSYTFANEKQARSGGNVLCFASHNKDYLDLISLKSLLF